MGLISYLKRALAATISRWIACLQLLNEALQKEYNHDAMIDEQREVSKLIKVHDAPREFVVDVCDAPGEFVENNFGLNYELGLLCKLEDKITDGAKKQEECTQMIQELNAMLDEYRELCAMLDEHGVDYVLSKYPNLYPRHAIWMDA